VLYQSHPSFILLETVLQWDLALLYLADDATEFLNCLFKAQFADIIFLSFVCHLLTFTPAFYFFVTLLSIKFSSASPVIKKSSVPDII
jgi:hypothetical protein